MGEYSDGRDLGRHGFEEQRCGNNPRDPCLVAVESWNPGLTSMRLQTQGSLCRMPPAEE